jgi:SAM-dependent methyltransferase
MLSISDSWQSGDPYERYVGRWSRQVAPRFLSWLALPPGRRWLDVGCGTGALCAAILDHSAPGAVHGIDPSEGFLKTAARTLPATVSLRKGSASSVPLDGASVDVVVSGLVLNFVPDAAGAVAEMARVCIPGGCIAAYVWDYAGKMELMRHFWDVATAVDPSAAALDEGTRFPLCSRGDGDRGADTLRKLRRLLEPVPGRTGAGAGLRHVARRGGANARPRTPA